MASGTSGGRCALCGAPTSLGCCERCAPAAEPLPARLVSTAPTEPAGVLLDGKYRLLEEIGRGGMGTVFKAVDEQLDRVVAVKLLLPELQQEPILVERFRREAKATASIRHPNVIRIYAFGRHGSSDFLVAEYLRGVTADRFVAGFLERQETPSLVEALWILEQTCAGLEAVHQGGVVHRDLKPGNLMIDLEERRVVIMDFGIGRRYAAGDDKATIAPGGTPAYMAPEVIAGAERGLGEDRLTDIYSLGVTAFELLTLRLPFRKTSWVDTLHAHLTEAPPPPSSLRQDLPRELDSIVLGCMAKSPTERFGSAEEVRQALLPLRREVRAGASPSPSPGLVGASGPAPAHARLRSRPAPVVVVVAHPEPAARAAVHEAAKRAFPDLRLLAARSAADGLALAREHRPDLLVAPLGGEELNGLEIAASLRGSVDLDGVHLALLGEGVGEGERRVLELLGVRAIVGLGAGPDELGAGLRRALGIDLLFRKR